jgi:hypothetical protein
LAKISHKNKNAGYNPMCKLGELRGFAWKYGEFGGFFPPKNILLAPSATPFYDSLSLSLSLSLSFLKTLVLFSLQRW